jgi:hypothetical protein
MKSRSVRNTGAADDAAIWRGEKQDCRCHFLDLRPQVAVRRPRSIKSNCPTYGRSPIGAENGSGLVAAAELYCADIGYQIGRQVRIEGAHRCIVGGVDTKADETIRPHKHRPAVRNTGCRRIEFHA